MAADPAVTAPQAGEHDDDDDVTYSPFVSVYRSMDGDVVGVIGSDGKPLLAAPPATTHSNGTTGDGAHPGDPQPPGAPPSPRPPSPALDPVLVAHMQEIVKGHPPAADSDGERAVVQAAVDSGRFPNAATARLYLQAFRVPSLEPLGSPPMLPAADTATTASTTSSRDGSAPRAGAGAGTGGGAARHGHPPAGHAADVGADGLPMSRSRRSSSVASRTTTSAPSSGWAPNHTPSLPSPVDSDAAGGQLAPGALAIGSRFTINPGDIDLATAVAVGSGAFGKVYKAKWHLMNIAIKVLHEENEAAQEEILKELHTLVSLGRHANIIDLLGAYRDSHGRINVCTTFMEEGTVLDILCCNHKAAGRAPCMPRHKYECNIQSDGLATYVNDHTPECEAVRPPLSHVLLYGSQAAAGLAHAHDMNVVHRDVACRNLLVDHGHVVVTDFGLARVLGADSALYANTKQNYGPLQWMAPEAIQDRAYSRMSDVWMLGVTLFEMVTYGAMPWAGLDPMQAGLKTLAGDTLLPQLPPNTPPGLYDLFEAMWQFKPADRPTMHTVHHELERLASEVAALETPSPHRRVLGPTPTGFSSPQAPSAITRRASRRREAATRPRWSWARMATVAAGAVLCTAALVWALQRYAPAPPSDGPSPGQRRATALAKRAARRAARKRPSPPKKPVPPPAVPMEPLHLRVLRAWNKLVPPQ